MQQINISLALAHPSPERLASQTCRHVLMSGLEDDAYIGDFSRILTLDIADRLLEQAYEKVIRLVNHINALKGARNSRSPISCLPPEVLLSIHKRCTLWDSSTSNKLAFSQVFTSWRRLDLADPTLWTRIDFLRPQLASLMMERAQQAPLSILISHSAGFRLDLLPERSRLTLQSFRTTQSARNDVEVRIHDYVSGNFPMLRTLQINIIGMPVIKEAALVAPVLQELTLSNFTLRDWGAHVVANLTFLEISYYDVTNTEPDRSPEPLWTPRSILAVLKLCPRLTSLSLRNLIDPEMNQERIDEDLEDVELANLKTLLLEDITVALFALLLRLRVPKCDHIKLICSEEAAESEVYSALPALVRQHVDAAGWHHMEIAQLDIFQSMLSLQLTPQSSDGIFNKTALELSIERYLQWGNNMNPFPRSLTDHLLRDTTMLTVDIDCSVSYAFVSAYWPRLWVAISTLCNLYTLEISGYNNISCTPWILLPFVPEPAVEDLADDIAMPDNPFYALRKLKIARFDLTESLHVLSYFQHLMVFKERRQAEGLPVEMDFAACKLPS